MFVEKHDSSEKLVLRGGQGMRWAVGDSLYFRIKLS